MTISVDVGKYESVEEMLQYARKKTQYNFIGEDIESEDSGVVTFSFHRMRKEIERLKGLQKYNFQSFVWNEDRNLDILFIKIFYIEGKDEYGNTPLVFYSRSGDKIGVKRLLNAGADINATNDFGRTALNDAAFHGCIDVVRYLLSRGADAFVKDDHGLEAFDNSRINSHRRVYTYLKKYAKRPKKIIVKE